MIVPLVAHRVSWSNVSCRPANWGADRPWSTGRRHTCLVVPWVEARVTLHPEPPSSTSATTTVWIETAHTILETLHWHVASGAIMPLVHVEGGSASKVVKPSVVVVLGESGTR